MSRIAARSLIIEGSNPGHIGGVPSFRKGDTQYGSRRPKSQHLATTDGEPEVPGWPQSRRYRRREIGSNAVIKVEHVPRQLIVAASLMVVTAVIQTIGIVLLEDRVSRWRDRVVEGTTRPR